MSRRWLLSLVCLSISLLLLAQISSARISLRVNETATRFSFRELAPEVSLVVENGSSHALPAVVRLELLDPAGKVKATTERQANLKTGSQKLLFTLPLNTRDLSPGEESEILWYRLHYRIAPAATEDAPAPIDGFISLSKITPDLFELRVAGTGAVREGMRYRARVHASHPITHEPAAGVQIKGVITLTDDDSHQETKLTDSALTSREGYADLQFTLPTFNADDLELVIEGNRGLLTVKAEKDVRINNQPYLLVSTDKSLYQPGQTLHARVLIFGPSKHAIPAKAVTIKITDPDDTTVFFSDLVTSRFGIASAEWAIPDNTRLGDYRLEFTTDGSNSNSAGVKIGRYELPNFTVSVKPDRAYYLSGQDATIEVRADYLFGKPVTRGHVRLVRETQRTWNYREQKYDTTERDKYEGEIGPDGIFKARIELTEDRKTLNGEDYNRYVDLPYAAYFTDPTTNRTEQRRFNLRLSKEAIHVYVIRSGNNYYQSSNLPLRFYVSTFYADGTPAQCSLMITQDDDTTSDSTRKPRVLIRTRTNRYGLADIEPIRLPADFDGSELVLNLVAKDRSGAVGSHAETFGLEDKPAIRVETTKSLFAAGEPIEATIISSEPNALVTVDVVREWSVIHSEMVRLHNGRAVIVLPYRPDYKDDLTIAAYADRGEDEAILGSRSILYPRNRDLKLNLQSTAQTYKPGERAHVSFRATDPEGRSVESALGIVVLDKAVEERVRTDQEFGSRYANFYSDILSLIGYGESVGIVSHKALEQLDMSRPISPDLDLAAEVLLNQGRGYYPELFDGDDFEKDQKSVFSGPINAQLKPLHDALNSIYENTKAYPADEPSLRRMLSTAGIDFQSLKDPWGTDYRPSFFIERQSDVLLIESAGADKQFDTEDDFSVARFARAYFRSKGEALDAAVRNYHQRTGNFIRDFGTLRGELARQGVELDTLRDRWSQPYKFAFDVTANEFLVTVTTITPASRVDGKKYPGEEFRVWQTRIDYFAESRAKIDTTLEARLKETNQFPQNDAQLRNALRPAGIDLDSLRDPWDKAYYDTFQVQNFYGDQVRIDSSSTYGQPGQQHIYVRPVTNSVVSIKLRSSGADLKEGTNDDFDVAHFSAVLTEQSATDTTPKPPKVVTIYSGSTGAIAGVVKDPNGAVIPGVTMKATRLNITETFESKTDEDGNYLLKNLPAGTYDLRADAPGFKVSVITNIVVRSSELVEVNLNLEIGAVTETVTVTSSGSQEMTMSETASAFSSRQVKNLVLLSPGIVAAKQQISTPRLREYFPETLVWQPELTTDKKGRAQFDFKLADNITTWKMSVIGSTEDGEIGTAETEIRAFQPFFAELDPPRVLTEGDRISLPVVLRNYLDKKQTVDLELKPESWFKVFDAVNKRSSVPPGDSANETFDIQAIASVKDGKQRVTAVGSELSDAIEKPVTVHPDGEEMAQTTSGLLENSTSVAVSIPAETIANSARVELKLYPNLLAHVWESVEGIMKRPYGCGEQTISSTYPSLMVLRSLKKDHQDSPVAEKARRYLQSGYQRLLGYQSESGGFTYWGHGNPDVALTAYALRFLHEASEVMAVDDSVIQGARSWLIKQQRTDGSWPATYWDNREDPKRTAMLTAVVARSLALIETRAKTGGIDVADPRRPPSKSALTLALDYLQRRSEEIDEPYLIASYSLAASLAGENSRAAKANVRLQALAHEQSNGTYWALETNTPFYGWGFAGRVETTALAVQALARSQNLVPGERQRSRDLMSRGLLFLLRSKDRYGVWYSTQATINVLDAMLALLSESDDSSQRPESPSTAEVMVNGQPAKTLELPTSRRLTAPLTVDLSAFIRTGSNQIELHRSGVGTMASLQVVTTYYIPWSKETSTEMARKAAGDSESLRLETSFNKKEAHVGEEITCHVKAERLGFRGYGMLLAEIGLPPGADVDRASLETAMRGSDWSIGQYDVLPDRVVVYLWPRAGGSTFDFKFRPRLAMSAKSSSSVIYDYYNPEAKAVVAPGTFFVK